MNRLTATITRHQTESRPPTFEQPMPTNAADFELLGEKRQHTYYRPRDRRYNGWEFVAGKAVADPPNRLLLAGPEPGTYIPLVPVPAGTFSASPVTTQPQPKPHRPVDALDAIRLFAGTGETIIAPPSANGTILPSLSEPYGRVIAGREPTRGVAAMLGRLADKGAVVSLATDRTHLVVTAPGGRPDYRIIEAIEAARPLLVAYLAGAPLACAVSAHDGKPPEAVTLALGGAPWCGTCEA